MKLGEQFGAFEVLAPLGSGGQSAVYLARPWAEQQPRRAVTRLWLQACLHAGALTEQLAARWCLGALKVARPGMADSLLDEHRHLAAAGAHHPHLACLYSGRFGATVTQPDLGLARAGAWTEARLCLGLAFEPGPPLSRLLRRWKAWRPAVRWSVKVATQVARALVHLHERGVVHHDVHPANVIIRPGPHAVLVDLGAAETPGNPRRRAIYGATPWLPPERRSPQPAPASPLVDIYGVGALLRVLTAHMAVPQALSALITEATAADPACRGAALPTMVALAERLEALQFD